MGEVPRHPGALVARRLTPESGVALPDDVPNPRRHTAGFMVRLLGARIARGFRVPAIDWAEET